jgi:hypothetical protein
MHGENNPLSGVSGMVDSGDGAERQRRHHWWH